MQHHSRKAIASEYMRANFRQDDRLAIVLIHKRSGGITTRVSTAEKIESDEYQAWLRHMNAQRHEIYVSMNNLRPEARGRLKTDVAEIRHIYLDFDQDGPGALTAMRDRDDLPVPNHVLTSSPGRFQVIWRVEGFRKDQAEELMRGMTRALGADVAATDCTRVLRVPGFYNHKYGMPHLVTVENLSNEVHRPEQFPSFESNHMPGRSEADTRMTPVRHELRFTTGGSQSERDWAFAIRALRRGEEPEDVARAIEEYRLDKPNPKYYARYTVEKARAVVRHSGAVRPDAGIEQTRR